MTYYHWLGSAAEDKPTDLEYLFDLINEIWQNGYTVPTNENNEQSKQDVDMIVNSIMISLGLWLMLASFLVCAWWSAHQRMDKAAREYWKKYQETGDRMIAKDVARGVLYPGELESEEFAHILSRRHP